MPVSLPWSKHVTALDSADAAAWSSSLGLFVVVGEPTGPGAPAIVTSPDGLVWTQRGNPWTDGGFTGSATSIVWADSLGLFVAVGVNNHRTKHVATSPDGITWTTQTTPWDGGSSSYSADVTWGEALGLFVVVGDGGGVGNDVLMTSPDGVTWTSVSTPFDGGFGDGVGYSPTLERFAWAGISNGSPPYGVVMISDDGVTWADQITPFDGFGFGNDVIWSTVMDAFLLLGYDSDVIYTMAASADGITWAPVTTQKLFRGDQAWSAFEANGRIIAVGGNDAGTIGVIQSYDGVIWTAPRPMPYSGDNAQGGVYSPELDLAVLVGRDFGPPPDFDPLAVASATPVPAPPTPPTNARFYESPPWRFILANLDGEVLSFLEPIAMNRNIVFTLNAPAIIGFDVPSDYPEVNLLDDDGYPLLSMNDKFVVCLRRENTLPGVLPPWVVRAVGLLMQPNDEITPSADAPVTHTSAFDPWQYWHSRPLLNNLGLLPGKGGLSYKNTAAAEILQEILNNSITGSTGGPDAAANLYTDFGQPFAPGGGDFYEGNLQTAIDDATTADVDINFRQGCMLGEAVTQLVEMGACDIILKPIWDPLNRPGLIAELYVYALAGTKLNNVVFSWDKPSRSLNGVNRLQDGFQMGNVQQYYAGQGGDPVPEEIDAVSRDHYGDFEMQEFYSGTESSPLYVSGLAFARALALKAGKETSTFDVAPEFGPIPFQEYNLGDQVRVYASNALRQKISPVVLGSEWVNMYRVYSIPVAIPDDATEVISQLLLSAPSPLPEE